MKSKAFNNLAIAIILLILSSITWGQEAFDFPDFSATQVFQSGKADMPMKIYRAGSSVRVERSAALATLYMPASSKVYNFTTYPDKSRQCVAMKPEQAKMLPSPLEMLQGPILKRTSLGTEVIEGHSCKVESIVVAQPDGKTIESKVWEAEDLKGIPVKIESHLEDVTLKAVYRDIVIGAPDQALFTVPEKCTPFEKTWQVAETKILK
jgi:hypothetical protein